VNGEQFKAALAELKLSQIDFALMLQIGKSSVSRWATDQRPIPPHVIFIIRMLRLVGIPIWMMPPERKPGRKLGVPQPRKKKRRKKRATRE
jgi:transcriptional regulator with XRE-family HTH domain